ncbi:MAG: CvpA family protein [Nitrospinota bacterium]
MYWFDIGAALFLIAISVHSAFRGLIKESVVLAAWISAYFGSVALKPLMAPLFRTWLKTGLLSDLGSFFFAFIIIYAGVRIAGVFILKKSGGKKIPSTIDHSAGAVVGGVKWLFYMAILLSPLDMYPDVKTNLVDKSFAADSVITLSKKAAAFMGAEMTEIPKELTDGIKRATESIKEGVKNGADSVNESLTKEKAAQSVEELTDEDKIQMDDLIKKLNRD